ncbi:MAG: hypothetical protein ACI841_004643 [Planctomycetota bacterium]|jgi:hypothetical protein
MQRITSEAESDDWKLDGPHLNGRFSVEEPGPIPESKEREGDKVTIAFTARANAR